METTITTTNTINSQYGIRKGVEFSLGAVVLSGIVVFAMTLFEEALNYVAIGFAIFACGAILLTFPLAKLVTKLTINLSRNIVLGIKRKFVRRGEK